ncbi:MAG: transposase [Pirellulales bacterium]|nr:transposase [Pirellulales bacterium]
MIALPSEKSEAILYGTVEALAFFGCASRELWWDNPKTVATTILAGRQRELNRRWQALASHYRFDPLFCLPARGNEKPHVENRVKLLERQWATPVPRLGDLAELNAYLRGCCQRDWQRTIAGQSETIGARSSRSGPGLCRCRSARSTPR